ncbi:MAG: hypothetical protein QXT06_04040 [Candidatus Bathyarchaeia archaeon]
MLESEKGFIRGHQFIMLIVCRLFWAKDHTDVGFVNKRSAFSLDAIIVANTFVAITICPKCINAPAKPRLLMKMLHVYVGG